MFFGVDEIASFYFCHFPTYASDPSNHCEIQSVSFKRKHKMTTWRFIFSRKQKNISINEITGCHIIDTWNGEVMHNLFVSICLLLFWVEHTLGFNMLYLHQASEANPSTASHFWRRGFQRGNRFHIFFCFFGAWIHFYQLQLIWVRIFSTRGMSAVRKNPRSRCHHFRILVVPFGWWKKTFIIIKRRNSWTKPLEKWVDWTSRKILQTCTRCNVPHLGLATSPRRFLTFRTDWSKFQTRTEPSKTGLVFFVFGGYLGG